MPGSSGWRRDSRSRGPRLSQDVAPARATVLRLYVVDRIAFERRSPEVTEPG